MKPKVVWFLAPLFLIVAGLKTTGIPVIVVNLVAAQTAMPSAFLSGNQRQERF